MNNSTNYVNSTWTGFNGTDYTVVDIVVHGLIGLLLCGPPVFFNIFSAIGIFTSKDITKPIKVALTNITVSGIVYLIGLHLDITGYVGRGAEPGRQPNSCGASVFIQLFGGSAAFFSLVLYGAAVYGIIRKGKKVFKSPILVLMAAIPWILALPNALALFIPSYMYSPRENSRARCGADFDTLSVLIHVGFSWGILGVCSCVTTLTLMIVTYCYVRKNAISGDTDVLKALYRLGGFLVLSTAVLVFFQLVVATIVTLDTTNGDSGIVDVFGYYLPITVFALSTWCTPISMVAIYKPLRQFYSKVFRKFKDFLIKIVPCKCTRKSELHSHHNPPPPK